MVFIAIIIFQLIIASTIFIVFLPSSLKSPNLVIAINSDINNVNGNSFKLAVESRHSRYRNTIIVNNYN